MRPALRQKAEAGLHAARYRPGMVSHPATVGLGALGAACALTIVAALFSACSKAPITGRPQLLLVPESQVEQMGDQAFSQIVGKTKVAGDTASAERVQRIGERIAAVAGGENEWTFVVLDEPKTINAWALPSGQVGVYTGLLNLGLSDDELAAVMAHEIGHVIAQHARERVSQEVGYKLGLALFDGQGVLTPAGRQLADIAFGLGVGLPYSRKQESEADLIGLNLMARAGYNPRAALSLWQKMRQAEDGARPPAFLSTHPPTEQRLRDIEAALPKVLPLYEANKRAQRAWRLRLAGG